MLDCRVGLGDIYAMRQAEAEAIEEAIDARIEAEEAEKAARIADEADKIRDALAGGDAAVMEELFWHCTEDNEDIHEIARAISSLAADDDAAAISTLERLYRTLVGRMAKHRVDQAGRRS